MTVAIIGGALSYISYQSLTHAASIDLRDSKIREQASGRALVENEDPLWITDNTTKSYRYSFDNRQTVTSTWPFTVGKGYNDKYLGKSVYEIGNYNFTRCIGVDYATTRLDTWHNACDPSTKATLWVANGGWLINVGYTNYQGVHTPTSPDVMTAGCNQNGCKAFVDNGGDWPSGQQNWTY